ncbi:MAG TPA: tRNA pseudouridine(38-40) synthase TruA [Candidatus Fusicatenibacter intestinigallinarum]|uniref:tRNA pseudouridine synthase A n=1 Tax=Candidatus Fusicatenibacter intestinigallinarum TaxID=2838598 RepID=A0A9D2N8H6_9FIRM|nr:tRNA pseudouridine(38-40) synthase TruA [Candidatus Fusicatenibacter intestinigallinarum]
MNYKLVLQYDGTRYDGWQKQGNTSQTIQGKLENVLSRLTGEKVEVHGAGRTDAGVHARGQTANVRLSGIYDPEELKGLMNRYLPEDIEVQEAAIVPERFHSRLNAVGKIYSYRLTLDGRKHVFERRFLYLYGKPLDIRAMRRAAEYLTGTHDFKSFCANRRMKKSTVRTVREIAFREEDGILTVSFTGDGFLYHMIRIIMGTLLEVGEGKRSSASMQEILDACDRQAAGPLAPAEGLTLEEVLYH